MTPYQYRVTEKESNSCIDLFRVILIVIFVYTQLKFSKIFYRQYLICTIKASITFPSKLVSHFISCFQ